jgi:hypothetical protein
MTFGIVRDTIGGPIGSRRRWRRPTDAAAFDAVALDPTIGLFGLISGSSAAGSSHVLGHRSKRSAARQPGPLAPTMAFGRCRCGCRFANRASDIAFRASLFGVASRTLRFEGRVSDVGPQALRSEHSAQRHRFEHRSSSTTVLETA